MSADHTERAPGARSGPDLAALAAAIPAVVAFAVYARTAYRTVPFWDAGEFIATSYTLGIPHQPSTPLYVLIGRLATLLPLGSIAFRVNMLSAVAATLTALFAHLAALRLGRRAGLGAPGALGAGLVAGLLTAAARTIWFNALEAEVYALSGLMVASAVWALVRWANEPLARRDPRLLLAVFYVLSLSIGIHLGTYLVLPALFVFFLRERPPGLLGARDLRIWLLAFPAAGLVLAGLAGAAGLGAAGKALALLVAYLACLAAATDRKLAGALLLLFVLGASVHLFLPIRSALGPMINEGQPDNWRAFWDTLTRAQYPPANPFVRRAPLGFQVDMFFRYVREQWPLFPGALGGILVPLLALAGTAIACRRDRSGCYLLLVLLLTGGPFLILYLNFTEHEVRERDYFFTLFYQAAALAAGLGAGALVAAAAGPGARSPARAARALAAVLILSLLAVVPFRRMWFEHDRSRDTIARDYALNLLVPMPRDAILFTNGDNDTFPPWYLQEVEKVRRDVRVVNLSLLNTPWYLRQIRDYAPEVPVALSDDEIAALRPVRDPATGRILMVKDLAVEAILAATPPERPLYLAVTVPDLMGLDERLTMEGLARRIQPAPTPVRVDVATSQRNVDSVFTPLRGIVTPDGATDSTLFHDENQRRLMQNYAAIHFYLAIEYDKAGDLTAALREAERALAVSPGFATNRLFLGMLIEKTGDVARAEAYYRDARARHPEDARFTHRLGLVLGSEGRFDEGVPLLKAAIARGGPDYFDPYASLFESYYRMGHLDSALAVLDMWLATHPDDAEVRAVRDQAARGERPQGERPPAERPPGS
jgi:Tfp pilus assembly protein PilF